MKASELIKELEKAIEEHGDLEVECLDINDLKHRDVFDVKLYPFNGAIVLQSA